MGMDFFHNISGKIALNQMNKSRPFLANQFCVLRCLWLMKSSVPGIRMLTVPSPSQCSLCPLNTKRKITMNQSLSFCLYRLVLKWQENVCQKYTLVGYCQTWSEERYVNKALGKSGTFVLASPIRILPIKSGMWTGQLPWGLIQTIWKTKFKMLEVMSLRIVGYQHCNIVLYNNCLFHQITEENIACLCTCVQRSFCSPFFCASFPSFRLSCYFVTMEKQGGMPVGRIQISPAECKPIFEKNEKTFLNVNCTVTPLYHQCKMDFFPDHLNCIISILLKHRFGCAMLYTFLVARDRCNCIKETNNWSNNKSFWFFLN